MIAAHLARYPLMDMEDLYKLLHQGVFGSEHAVESRAEAAMWLAEEIASLGPSPSSSLAVEPVAPAGRLVRVHLREYLAAGGDHDALLDAFVRTAGRRTGSPAELRCAGGVAADLTEERWPRTEWERYIRGQIERGAPSVHHSEAYAAAYRPAYRVVASDLLPLAGA